MFDKSNYVCPAIAQLELEKRLSGAFRTHEYEAVFKKAKTTAVELRKPERSMKYRYRWEFYPNFVAHIEVFQWPATEITLTLPSKLSLWVHFRRNSSHLRKPRFQRKLDFLISFSMFPATSLILRLVQWVFLNYWSSKWKQMNVIFLSLTVILKLIFLPCLKNYNENHWHVLK